MCDHSYKSWSFLICSVFSNLNHNRVRYKRIKYKPHQGEGTGQAGHCGAPAVVPRYCGGPCPLQLFVPAQLAGERLETNSSGQRCWRPSCREESHRCWLTAALRHPEPHKIERWGHVLSVWFFPPFQAKMCYKNYNATYPITHLIWLMWGKCNR